MAEKILKRLTQDQYIQDLALYTVATNLVRALPDARDGFKPVSRRILYALMNDEKAVSPSTQVKSAAVADYRPAFVSDQKIKKKAGEAVTLNLVENPDIAKTLGQRKKNQVLVVFAAETQNMMENARTKLVKKNADLMVANDVTRPGAGFDVDTNIVTLIPVEGEIKPLPCMSKDQVADKILDEVAAIMAQRA